METLETIRGKEVRDGLPNTSRCPPWKQDRSEQRARGLAPPSTLPHSVSPSCDRSSHGATQLSLGLSELLSDQSGECQNPWSKARLRLWLKECAKNVQRRPSLCLISHPSLPCKSLGNLEKGGKIPDCAERRGEGGTCGGGPGRTRPN